MSKSIPLAQLCAVAVAALGLALAGCAQNRPQNPPAGTTTTVNNPPPAPTTANPPAGAVATTPPTNNVNAGRGGALGPNAGVAYEVNKAIHTNVQMTGSRIVALVDNSGVATLTGMAQNQQQKALAVRAATDTPGVTSVKDKIVIAPTGGVHSAAATRVIHKVFIVHEPPASSPPSAGSDGAAAGNATPGSAGNGTGTNSASSTTNGSPAAPAPANGNGQ